MTTSLDSGATAATPLFVGRSRCAEGTHLLLAVALSLGILAVARGEEGPPDPDADQDGLADLVETGTGVYRGPEDTGTDPTRPDTDEDGLSDGVEVLEVGTDPNLPDTDQDGRLDGFDGLPTLRIFVRLDLPQKAWAGDALPVRLAIESFRGFPIPELPPIRLGLSATGGTFLAEARAGAILQGAGTSEALVETEDGLLEVDFVPAAAGAIAFYVTDPEDFGLGVADGGPDTYRINCGGEEYVDSEGFLWSSDFLYLWGRSYGYTDEVLMTVDAPLYQTERFFPYGADTAYAIPVEPGRYEVRLHFVEMCYWCSLRVFDVILEGERVIESLDLATDPGYFIPLVASFDITIDDGSVDIGFWPISENPKIAAIEVLGMAPFRGRSVVEVFDGDADPDADGLTDREEEAAGTDRLDPDTDQDAALDGSDPVPLSALDVALSPLAPALMGVPSGLEVSFSRADGLPLDPGARIRFSLVASEGATFVGPAQRGTILSGEGTEETLVESEGPFAEVSFISGEPWVTIRVVDSLPSGIRVGPRWESLFRVNCGGGEYVDGEGLVWEADQYFGGGSEYSAYEEVAGTDDDPLFWTERYGHSVYSFPTDPGEFLVRLLFAEVWYGAQSPGVRVFDVEIAGEIVLDDLDITAAVGWATAYERTFEAEADGELLEIQFLPVIENPKISAIEILEQVAATSVRTIHLEPADSPFLRGDADGDGDWNITDPLAVLRYLFGPDPLTCLDAGDADDDGILNITDPILILNVLFRSGYEIPEPLSSCDRDPTPDALPCATHGFCASP